MTLTVAVVVTGALSGAWAWHQGRRFERELRGRGKHV